MADYGPSSQQTMDDQRERMREQSQRVMEGSKQALEQVEEIPSNVYYGAVLGSMVVSLLLFISGKRNLGLFVGLWPPTILNLALFAKQLRPSREVDRTMDRMGA